MISTECYKCERRNHYARVCHTKVPRGRPKLCELEYDSSSEDNMVVDTISSESSQKDWHATIKVNEHDVRFNINTGMALSVTCYHLEKLLSYVNTRAIIS